MYIYFYTFFDNSNEAIIGGVSGGKLLPLMSLLIINAIMAFSRSLSLILSYIFRYHSSDSHCTTFHMPCEADEKEEVPVYAKSGCQ